MYRVYCDSYLLHDPRLSDLKLINPKCDLELNKTGSFTFTIYPNHPYFDKLKKLKSVVTIYQDDDLLFRGRILDDKSGMYNEKQITCEGELAFLLDSFQRPYDFMSGDKHTTIPELFQFFLDNHNAQVEQAKQFKIGNITVTDPNNYIVRSDTNYKTTWDALNEKLVEPCGGYLFVRHEEDGNYLDYLVDFQTISSQSIEFGKNMIDISQTLKGADIATALIPLGAQVEGTDERLTIKSVNNDVDFIYDQNAVNTYGWIFKTQEWNDVTEPSNLLTKAQQALSESVLLNGSIELSAVDLSAVNAEIQAFKLGQYVHVKSKPHNLDANFLVSKLSINLTKPSQNKLTLGVKYSALSESMNNADKTTNQIINTVNTIQKDFNTDAINDSINDLDGAIVELERRLNSQISQTSEEIYLKVSEEYATKGETQTIVESMNTELTQTKNQFEFMFNEFNLDLQDVANGTDAKFQDISKYIRFVNGNIIIGIEGNQLTLKLQNNKIVFLDNNSEVAYLTNRKMYVTDGEFLNELRIGNYAFIPRANGNLSFKKVV